MTLAVACPITAQVMVAIMDIKWFIFHQSNENCL